MSTEKTPQERMDALFEELLVAYQEKGLTKVIYLIEQVGILNKAHPEVTLEGKIFAGMDANILLRSGEPSAEEERSKMLQRMIEWLLGPIDRKYPNWRDYPFHGLVGRSVEMPPIPPLRIKDFTVEPPIWNDLIPPTFTYNPPDILHREVRLLYGLVSLEWSWSRTLFTLEISLAWGLWNKFEIKMTKRWLFRDQ